MGDLHGRGIGIFVAGYNLDAVALEFDSNFFAEFAAAKQQGFLTRRGHDGTNFCHSNCLLISGKEIRNNYKMMNNKKYFHKVTKFL